MLRSYRARKVGGGGGGLGGVLLAYTPGTYISSFPANFPGGRDFGAIVGSSEFGTRLDAFYNHCCRNDGCNGPVQRSQPPLKWGSKNPSKKKMKKKSSGLVENIRYISQPQSVQKYLISPFRLISSVEKRENRGNGAGIFGYRETARPATFPGQNLYLHVSLRRDPLLRDKLLVIRVGLFSQPLA